MAIIKLAWIIGALTFWCNVFGQKPTVPFQSSNNFLAYKFSVGYPFLTPSASQGNYKYSFSNKTLNYSFNAGLEAGHFFSHSFSISFSPVLMYSKFSKFDYRFTEYQNSVIESELNAESRVSHLTLLLPSNFEFRINEKFSFATGFFLLKPFTHRSYSTGVWTDYSYDPPKMTSDLIRDYRKFDSYFRGGLHGKASYNFKSRHWVQKWICIEYYHSFTNFRYNTYENWLLISFKKLFFQ